MNSHNARTIRGLILLLQASAYWAHSAFRTLRTFPSATRSWAFFS